MSSTVKIAIDGPAGSGKSTIAKLLAEKLGYLYIDSGAMYRAVTYKWLESSKPDSLDEITADISIDLEDNSKKVYVDGKDVSSAIRTNEVSQNVSHVASFKVVRDKLVDIQREISKSKSVVMDGRDIGTVVFPKADFKFFMVASPKIRAERRIKDLHAKGEDISLEELTQQIIERDKKDSEREISPLKKADDAIEINTDNLSIDEVLNLLLENLTYDKANAEK